MTTGATRTALKETVTIMAAAGNTEQLELERKDGNDGGIGIRNAPRMIGGTEIEIVTDIETAIDPEV